MTDPAHDPNFKLLHDYADRWRAGLDATSCERAPVASGERAPLPRRWPVLLASAAVLAVVAAASFLAASHSTSPRPLPVTNSNVVPWKPLPSTHPRLPVRRIPARPVPGAAPALPACTADQVRTRSGEEGATGNLIRWVELRLVGDNPCKLPAGYPGVEPVFHGPGVPLPVVHEHRRGYWPATAPVPLRRGHPAVISIWWPYSSYCGPRFDNPTLLVTAPGLAPARVPGFGRQDCANGPPRDVPSIAVYPTTPRGYEPARVESAWRGVRASGDLRLTARPVSLVHFTITLVSPRDLVLDPCPDYQMLLAGPGIAPQQSTYALNCAAVPYRDAAGKPMLPAHTPVTFAMRVRAPQQSATKFIWSLGPKLLGVATGGQLTVAPTGQSPVTGPARARATS